MSSRIDPYIELLPHALKAPTRRWFSRLAEQASISDVQDDQLKPLVQTVACSEFAQNALLREWRWFIDNQGRLAERPADLTAFKREMLNGGDDADTQKSALRRCRNRYQLWILWRECNAVASLDETLLDLSVLAETLLLIANRLAARAMAQRFGVVLDDDGSEVPLLIVGMGKLGGRELNFSSDIDIMFCYPHGTASNGARSLSAQEYFARQSRIIIALLDERTADGFCFRVDTRLRPFGESGPPVVSFAALESYLVQHGRDWERYAYVKARLVGSGVTEVIEREFYNDLIKPFVYRRYLDYGVFEALRDMQSMIATEVQQKSLANNIKRGPGGIREAEFVVQAFQLVRGGREPDLQRRALQRVLPLLSGTSGLSGPAVQTLLTAYRFLRRVENFIQGLRDEQTHDVPDEELDRARLCLAMGYSDWAALQRALDIHREAISECFDEVAFRGDELSAEDGSPYVRLWSSGADVDAWMDELRGEFANDSDDIAKQLVEFHRSRSLAAADSVSQQRLGRLIPNVLNALCFTSHPVTALARLLTVIQRILRRSAYLALLNENPAALKRLINLCGRSQMITEQISRSPMLLDELLDPQVFSGAVTKLDLAEELELRLNRKKELNSEERMQVIARFQRATLFRIAIADFQGDLPIMKVSDGLTWLAEVVLDETLRTAWADLVQRHGVPMYTIDGEQHEAGFGVLAYGKLGGIELSYGSDLDVVFLHSSKGSEQATNGEKPLDNTRFFGRLVQRLTHFLTTQTDTGALYDIDTRLRPDGRSGLLVSSTEAFLRYQEANAWTWEHQALLRARAVTGDPGIAAAFEKIRRDTLIQRVDRSRLKSDVVSMRQRMRKELDRSDATMFDLKQGEGGIGDLEFIVQYLVLNAAASTAAVIHFTDNIRQLDALVDTNIISSSDGARMQNIYKQYRLHLHHCVLDGKSALISQDLFRDERNKIASIWERWLG